MLSFVAMLVARACAAQALCSIVPEGACAAASPLSQAEAGALAQAPSDAWRHSIALYFMAAGLDGTSTVKGIDADVDVDFSDIWSHLEGGAMLAYRAESQRYAITVDAIYMGLGGEKDSGPVTAKVGFDELVVEVDGCLRVNPRTDVYLGARYWGLDADLDLSGPGNVGGANGSKEWVDPVLGARYAWPFADQWSLILRGDVGGFGVGSEFAWQALARLNWDITSSTALSLGYRVVDVDYADGSGTDEFRYDITTSGFLAGLIFSF